MENPFGFQIIQIINYVPFISPEFLGFSSKNHQLRGFFHYKPSISGIFHYKPEILGFSTRISTIISGYPQLRKTTTTVIQSPALAAKEVGAPRPRGKFKESQTVENMGLTMGI